MEYLNINPWTSIWTHPKKTMRAILDWDPKKIIIWLAVFGGVISMLVAFLQHRHQEWIPFKGPWFIALILIGGAILGFFHLYFGGWLYQLTSSWIGGKGNFIETKSAVGWGNYPAIVASIFFILSLVFYQNLWLRVIFAILYAIIAIWGIVIFLNLLAEAQKFSAWRALAAVLIAAVLIIVVVMIISVLVPLIAPLFSQSGS